MFAFKQFKIEQDRCAMKVGTDGVLLGAWTEPPLRAKRGLDIGTGTGVVALILAQRFSSLKIDAVEIDEGAAEQAVENVNEAPFGDRVRVVCDDIKHFNPKERYDVIVCNPPYFIGSMGCPDGLRNQARHSVMLEQGELLDAVVRLLNDGGEFTVIYPTNEAEMFLESAEKRGLYLVRELDVYPTPKRVLKRKLMSFSFEKRELEKNELVIELGRHVYSDEYVKLTKEFYLNF